MEKKLKNMEGIPAQISGLGKSRNNTLKQGTIIILILQIWKGKERNFI